jgi:hypothetical protein
VCVCVCGRIQKKKKGGFRVSVCVCLLLVSVLAPLALLVGRPESEVVSEQLHDERRVLIVLFLEPVCVCGGSCITHKI